MSHGFPLCIFDLRGMAVLFGLFGGIVFTTTSLEGRCALRVFLKENWVLREI